MFEENVLKIKPEQSFVGAGEIIRTLRERKGWGLQNIANQAEITIEE
jgi:hypothetical protein